uniref:Uncharacterized protein n=1 Tax=Panagrolaimus sp. ES5 TaxID=591445 RepID=A0AC34F0W9_9BILA
MDKSENSLVAENERLKQLVEKLQKAICNQAINISRLEDEKDVCLDNSRRYDDIDTEDIKDKEEELQSKYALQIEDERKKYESELAELKATFSKQVADLEKQNEAQKEKIKNLDELLLLSAKNVKSESQQIGLQDQIDKLQSSNDNSDKKIKELEAQLESKTKTENLLKARMDERKQQNDNQKKLLTIKDKEFKAAVQERNKTIKDLEAKLVSKTKKADALQSKIDEMKQRQNQLHTFLQNNDTETTTEPSETQVPEIQKRRRGRPSKPGSKLLNVAVPETNSLNNIEQSAESQQSEIPSTTPANGIKKRGRPRKIQ